MTVDWFLRHISSQWRYEEVACARYLERATKLKFLVDFGFENAPDLAFNHLESLPDDYPMGHA